MAQRKNRKDSTATWLVADPDQKRAGSARNRSRKDGAKDENWLAVPDPAPGGDGRGNGGRPARGRGRAKPRRVGESSRERRLSAKLHRARDQLQAQANEIEGLRERVDELEGALEARPAARNAPRGKARRPKRRGAFDANSATFEELRELGLSVTQSARVIGYRETNGGFTTASDLKRLPGLPQETISTLVEASSRPQARSSGPARKRAKGATKKSSGSKKS